MPQRATIAVPECQVDLAVQRGGAGPPLLFLPDAQIGAAWLPFHDRLAERVDVIVAEHPGYGGGDAPPWLDRIADLANFYLDALARLDLKRVHLVGAALGGWVAAELATRNTARLASLTLIDPWGSPSRRRRHRPLRHQRRTIGARPLRRAERRRCGGRAHPGARGRRRVLKGKTVTAKLAWQPRLHDPHLAKWPHRIDVLTLIVWGAQDRLLPPAYAAAWQRAIPGRAPGNGAGRRTRAACGAAGRNRRGHHRFHREIEGPRHEDLQLPPDAPTPTPTWPRSTGTAQAWVTFSNKNYDPVKGAELFNDYLDELERADELGFDGVCVNEHHQTAYGMMPVPGVLAGALSPRSRRAGSRSSAAPCRW